MYFLRAIVGYVGLLVGLAALAHASATLAARWLGVAPFRWFDGRPALGAWWRRLAVRVISSVTPLCAILLLLFLGHLARGSTLPSTAVEVRPGPAESAGIRSGDRILSVDGKHIDSFDSLRREIQRGSGERQIELERRGQKLLFAVTPQGGRISVSPIYERRELGASEALGLAVQAPATALGTVLNHVLSKRDDSVTLTGPVAIVRETESQPSSSSFFVFLGLLASFCWPLVAGVHLFDALTLALFRATHPWAFEDTAEREVARLARLQQTLAISLMALPLLALLQILAETGLGAAARLGIVLLCPAGFASVVLVSIATFEHWGKSRALAVLACSLLAPCSVVGIGFWLTLWMRRELARRGFRVRWLLTTPKPASA